MISRKEYQKIWYLKNKDRISGERKIYYSNNKERFKNIHRKGYYKRLYNLTYNQVLEMWENQNRKCITCNKKIVLGGCRLNSAHIDHDHKTGAIRGILCHRCNTSIGLLNENINTLKNIIIYLS